jgi:single-strand DNA-binding protein
MGINLNRVMITGNLTQEPVLLEHPSAHRICELHVGCNRKMQNHLTGEWHEWADYFHVRVFGGLAPVVHRRLRKGSGIAIDGRLASRRTECSDPGHEWEVIVIAEAVQFIPKGTTYAAERPSEDALAVDRLMVDRDEPPAINAPRGATQPPSALEV